MNHAASQIRTGLPWHPSPQYHLAMIQLLWLVLGTAAARCVGAAPVDDKPDIPGVKDLEHLHPEGHEKPRMKTYYFQAFPNSNVPTEPVFLLMIAVFGSMIFLICAAVFRFLWYYIFGRGVVSDRDLATANLRVVGIKHDMIEGHTPSQESVESKEPKADLEAQTSSNRKSKDANVISGPIVPVLRNDAPVDVDEEEEEEEEVQVMPETPHPETQVQQVQPVQHEQVSQPADIPEGEAPAYDTVVQAAPPISDSLSYMPSYSSGATSDLMPNSTSYKTFVSEDSKGVSETIRP